MLQMGLGSFNSSCAAAHGQSTLAQQRHKVAARCTQLHATPCYAMPRLAVRLGVRVRAGLEDPTTACGLLPRARSCLMALSCGTCTLFVG